MSTSQEIQEVLREDINRKSQQVFHRAGIIPFLDGLKNFHIEPFILDEEDRELLRRILDGGE